MLSSFNPRMVALSSVLLALAVVVSMTAAPPRHVDAETLGSAVLFEGHSKGVATTRGAYSLIQEFVEVEPGHFTTTRLVGNAYWFVTVVEGTLTMKIDQVSAIVGPGQSIYIPPGAIRRYENNSLAKVRFMESIIAPPGAGPSPAVAAPSSTLAVVTFQQIQPLGSVGDRVDVVQQAADLAPGYQSTNRVANANNLITVTAGELTLRYADGAVEKVAANKAVKIATGRAYSVANEGAAKTSYMATWVSNAGTSPTSIAPAAAPAPAPASGGGASAITPPRTGDAGLAAGRAGPTGLISYAMVLAAIAASTAVVARRLHPLR